MFEHPAVRLEEVKNIQSNKATIVGSYNNGNYFSTDAFEGDALLGSANVNGDTQFNFDAETKGTKTGTFEVVVDGLTDGNTVEVAAAISDPGGPLAKSEVYEFTAGDPSTEFVNEFDEPLEAEVKEVHAVADSGRGNRYEMSSGDVFSRNVKAGEIEDAPETEFFVNVAFDNSFTNEPTGVAITRGQEATNPENKFQNFSRKGFGIKNSSFALSRIKFMATDSDHTVTGHFALDKTPEELAEDVL